jgi:FdhD protein
LSSTRRSDEAGSGKETAPARVWRLSQGDLRADEATIIVEEPLEIFVDGAPYAVVMRTPGDDIALAAGFCLAEGLIDGPADLGSIQACDTEDANRVAVVRTGEREPPSRAVPHAVSSSCGLCGREMIEDIVTRFPAITEDFSISLANLLALAVQLQQTQRHFKPTGGTHAAALFGRDGDLLSAAEDVGRHNALDKAIGRLLLSGQLAAARVAVLSGRCSFEMVQKVARAGIPIVASVSAPTALAIQLAQRAGVTLVGFVRRDSLTVYFDGGRISDVKQHPQPG